MKKLILVGIMFLALTLIASPVIAARRDHDHIGNFNFVVEMATSEAGDNVGVLLRGIDKEDIRLAVAEERLRKRPGRLPPNFRSLVADGKHDMMMAAIKNIRMIVVSTDAGDNVGVLLRGVDKDDLRFEIMDWDEFKATLKERNLAVYESGGWMRIMDRRDVASMVIDGSEGQDARLVEVRTYKSAIAGGPGDNIGVLIRGINKDEIKRGLSESGGWMKIMKAGRRK